ncbi:MAG: glycoside hydrolase family 3 C-terminal domain-containing protein [Lachnospiraceae bacterium]|nr:glycoside hydrolase family 3 C-terminal domain-containing protein [Lachnospiraceae bacterium]
MAGTISKERRAECRRQAAELVAQMTLEEKVGQTLNWAKAIDRLGVKAYNWWNESLHGVARAGVATVFPQAITMACSFDEDLLEQVGDVISTEARAKFNMQQEYGDTDIYKGLTMWAPNVNIFRDPRWGRGHETYGEDPFLTSRLGVRFVEGLQGHDPKYLKLAACGKHFAVHSGPEDIRHSFNAVASKQDMRETYLPAFHALVTEAGVETIMGAYNRTNGEPCCGSRTLLQDILRKEWGFAGHVVSDCWAIKDFHEGHHVTETASESVALAANNGCDLNCGDLFPLLYDCVKSGKVSQERLDEMVTNLMTTRFLLGTLGEHGDNPYDAIDYLQCDTPENRRFNQSVSERCAVLLKNEKGILPLDPKAIRTIGVIGPNANNRRALVGNYEGTASEYVTVVEGIQEYLGDRARVLYSEGCHLYKDRVQGLGQPDDRLAEAKGVCAASDVVVCVLGLDSGLEGEEGDQGNQYASGDKPNLELPGRQQALLDVAVASGKPVVLVLLAGSALAVTAADEKVPGILYAGYPGAQGGRAIARILFGEVSPEGKLPVTFYRTSEELPEFTDYAMKGRTYRYMDTEALYPFGYGLSYTSFALQNAGASDLSKAKESGATVRVTVTNTGACEGAETVQVYVRFAGPGIPEGAPKYQLKGLRKVRLAAGESKEVEITLTKESFGLYDENGELTYPEGAEILVGTHAPDARSEALTGSGCITLKA